MKTNKVVLITGASKGIGYEIGKLLEKEGFSLSLSCRHKENLVSTFGEKSSNLLLECDVSSIEDINKLVKETIKKFGKIDVLINNAGLNQRVDFMSTSEKDWSNIIDTNLRSTFFLSQLVGGHMLKKKSGKIINISSILGITADSVTVQYGVSKSALITLTKYVAKLFAPYVTVNSISPGFVETDWHKDKTKERIKKITNKIPLKRFAKPEEIAELCHFLISKGDYITGENIVIDGGYLL